MIHWMQKHKKYLVITIWISTIAFVGAGFVGWGTYSFGSGSSWVAKVGDTKITQDELHREYSRLFTIYNQLMGGKLGQKEALSLGIQTQALDNLIYSTLMLNYAKDLGISISDEAIAQEITKEEEFYELGLFSEKKYREILAANHLKPSDYEEAIAKSLLLEKLNTLLNVVATPLEKESAGAALYMQDNLSVSILEEKKHPIEIDAQEMKEYWEKNVQSYMGEKYYEIVLDGFKADEITATTSELQDFYERFRTNYVSSNKKPIPFESAQEQVQKDYKESEAEKKALRRYVEYKKNLEQYEGQKEILSQKQIEERFGKAFMEEFLLLKAKEALKPMKTEKEGYVTLKLLKINEAQPLEFEVAKEQVSADIIRHKRNAELESDAKKELENFKGEKIGWVGRDDVREIMALSTEETANFLSFLFAKLKPKDYMITNGKAILYEVNAQRLSDIKDLLEDNKVFLEENMGQLKQKLVESAFISYLQKRYEVVRLDK